MSETSANITTTIKRMLRDDEFRKYTPQESFNILWVFLNDSILDPTWDLKYKVANARTLKDLLKWFRDYEEFDANQRASVDLLNRRIEAEQGIVMLRAKRAEEGLPNDSIALQLTLPEPAKAPVPPRAEWMKRLGFTESNLG